MAALPALCRILRQVWSTVFVELLKAGSEGGVVVPPAVEMNVVVERGNCVRESSREVWMGSGEG